VDEPTYTIDDAELRGRVALVTGAAGGIGRALVARLAAAGASVVATDLEAPDPDLWPASGDAVVPVACDVADVGGVDALVAGVVERFDRIDIVVNNAGVFDAIISTARLAVEDWDRDLGINLSGPFYAIRAALPHMLRQGYGRIVNISSISSGGAFKQASYGATKLGLIALTRSVALEFAPAGITANAVLPGLIGTAKARSAPQDIIDGALRTIPAGRLGREHEVAELVAFLASDRAAYINGAAIPVDGGAMLLQLRIGRDSTLRPGAP
jgi:NAD(P)-dependent dehydrogenase (short-subunit alcohol dehydrogenase family)